MSAAPSSAAVVPPAAVRTLPAAFSARDGHTQQHIIGLMSGTSLDGVDAVLARFNTDDAAGEQASIVAHHFVPMPAALRSTLLALNSPSASVTDGGELHQMALASNALSHLYSEAVHALLEKAQLRPEHVQAIGNHGQTIRHLPSLTAAPATTADGSSVAITRAYTLQIGNHALLAELTGIPVIGDFRSRDVAAGGQGAPLVPAFHKAFFGSAATTAAAKAKAADNSAAAAAGASSSSAAAAAATATSAPAPASGGLLILNLGGIANLSHLRSDGSVSGFDTGPANVLSDLWIHSKRLPRDHEPGAAGTVALSDDLAPIHEFDPAGIWASRGTVQPDLLRALLDSEPYFAHPPPKSTGRDLFNPAWLEQRGIKLEGADSRYKDEDVAATLVELTAVTIAQALEQFCSEQTAAAAASSSSSACSARPSSSPSLDPILVCGGGAHNSYLLSRLQCLLPSRSVLTTSSRGVPAECVESLAFAWMAHQFLQGKPANLPAVTGAKGLRVLGCYYPA